MHGTHLARLAQLGEELERTSKRLELTALLASFLRGLAPEEIPPAVRLAIGQVFPEWDARTLNLSWKAVMAVVDELIEATAQTRGEATAQAVDGGEAVQLLLERARRQPPSPPSLTIVEAYRTLEEIAETQGRGSRHRKEALLKELLVRATPVEAKHLAKVVYQEMRHGVSEGLMLDGIARASGIKARWVRRANQLWGDIGEVALVALTEGDEALRQATVRLFRPVKPMLAQTAEGIGEAFERFDGNVALEYKLDGARVQIHRRQDQIRLYSRNLTDVTDSLPDLVTELQLGLAAEDAVLEGEAIAVDAQGTPLPFQHLMRRFRRVHDIAATVQQVPVQLQLFDLLYANGGSLVDQPNRVRWQALEKAAGSVRLVSRVLPASVEESQAFAEAAYRDGHEGLMAKDLRSGYSPGVRGKSWLKLKRVVRLDMVIVAADWGYGRRHGWLSNYHLAVRDERTGEYLVVGKTFKGLTDRQFEEMTRRLLALERGRKGATVYVQPEVVVEVLFNEIQESRQYKPGLTLRFARISHLRGDKRASEIDTVQTLRQLHEQQFRYKGRRG